MDHPYYQYRQTEHHAAQTRSLATYFVYSIAAVYIIHQLLVYYDYPVLSPQEILWNALVYVIPKQVLLDRARREELKANGMLSQTHAAKSEALRRVLGIGGNAVLQKLPAEGIMRRMSGVGRLHGSGSSDAPAGLGNWDNSCYQNSVLQGLASLDSLQEYLGGRRGEEGAGEGSTTSTLREFVGRLNDEGNNGRHLWTPAKLKSMSSWQQQDAQEYYSKILDELDKEASKSLRANMPKPGLEGLVQHVETDAKEVATDDDDQRNPLDGLLAQRVACTKCGYSEGLSMIPFNCLTLPLGDAQYAYNLEECLDEYTKLEEISDVECAKCTLLRAEQQLTKMLPSPPSTDSAPAIDSRTLALPPELRAQAFQRLSAIQKALEDDDFADKTLHETCQIPKKARVSSTKTRQAVVGRAPQSLCLHVNRSVFDEMAGVQRKNYAGVRWPLRLDLRSWVLPTGVTDKDATGSLLLEQDDAQVPEQESLVYRIKAVVTHYGRHENGHYICYKQHPARIMVDEVLDGDDEGDDGEAGNGKKEKGTEMRWWRLSDEDVSAASEEAVLKQGGVFMLFYEREVRAEMPVRELRLGSTIGEADGAGVTVSDDPAPEDELAALEKDEATASPRLDNEETSRAEIEHPITLPEPSPAPSSSPDPEEDSTKPTTPASVHPDSISAFDQDPPSTEATTEDERELSDCGPSDSPSTVAKQQNPSACQASPSKEATTHNGLGNDQSELPPPGTKQTTPPSMRTARSHQPQSPPNKDGGFGVGGSGFRVVAAT